MSRRHFFAAVAGIVNIAAPSLLATAVGIATAQDVKAPGYAQRWTNRLQENDQRLQAGNWKQAERDARRLLQDIVDTPQGRLLQPVGAAAYQYALALAGLGRMEDARWHAEVARAFHPTIPVDHLQPIYGEPGRRVAAWFREAAAHWDSADPASPECGGEETDPEFTYPAKLTGDDPTYTEALRRQRAVGTAAVSLVIDKQGTPHAPQLVESQTTSIGFLWAALEALRTWRFEPAQRDGEPVACRYTLTTSFDLSGRGF